MSLQALILSLLEDIPDAAARTDIATSIFYLRDLYVNGQIKEADLRNDLAEVVSTVLSLTHPELLPEELKAKTKELVEQLMRAIKAETIRARLMRRRGLPFRPPV